MTPWLAPWTWYYSSTSVISGNTHDREFGADGVDPHPHEEETGATNHEAKDGVREISSSASVTTAMQTPETGDLSSLNYTHNEDSLHDPPTGNNPVASTITSHTSGWASSFSSRSLVVSLGYGTANAGLVEDMVKRDENGMEVMDLDLDDRVEDEAETIRGRGVQREDVDAPGLSSSVKVTSNNPLSKLDVGVDAGKFHCEKLRCGCP